MSGLIVVATDLSPRSSRALMRAEQLAAEHEAGISILHVLDQNLPRRLLRSFSEQIRTELQQQARRCGVDLSGANSAQVITGNAQTIVRHAEDRGAQLIVLGMHDRGLSEEPRFGAKTEHVLRSTKTPVLITRDRASGPYRRVAIGVDFSTLSRAALRTAFGIAPAARFHLLHAYEVPFKVRLNSPEIAEEFRKQSVQETQAFLAEEMRALTGGDIASADSKQFRVVVARGEPSRALRREADRIRAELLVVGSHGRSALARFFLGSVASSLIAHPPCDLLVVQHPPAGSRAFALARPPPRSTPREKPREGRGLLQHGQSQRRATHSFASQRGHR
jgi:nucleotide-binding universal stress UspA family protein